MSDLIDEFWRAAEKTGVTTKAHDQEANQRRNTYIDNVESNCPPAIPFVRSLQHEGHRILRRAFRRSSGAEFANGADVYQATLPDLRSKFRPLYIEAFALGVALGERHDPVDGEEAWGHLVTDEEFRDQVRTRSMVEFSADLDFSTVVEEYSSFTIDAFLDTVSFWNMPPPLAIPKIWDCWWFTAQVTAAHLFATGYEMGSARRVMAALTGIAQVSRLGEDDES